MTTANTHLETSLTEGDAAGEHTNQVSAGIEGTVLSLPVGIEDERVRIYAKGEIDSALITKRGRWSPEELATVSELFLAKTSMLEMVSATGRSPSAIIGALARTGVVIEDHPYKAIYNEVEAKRAEERAKATAEAKTTAEAEAKAKEEAALAA